MQVVSPKTRRKTKIIDKQVFFLLGDSEGPKDIEDWKMILKSLGIRTRTVKFGRCGVSWSPVFGPDYEIWCNLKDFRKALKKNNTSFRGFLLEFGAKIYSGSIRLPTG